MDQIKNGNATCNVYPKQIEHQIEDLHQEMVMQLAMCAKTNQGLDRGFAWISGSLTRNILSLESGNAIKMDQIKNGNATCNVPKKQLYSIRWIRSKAKYLSLEMVMQPRWIISTMLMQFAKELYS